VLRLGFADLGLHRISLNVFTHNRAALACYQSLGFRVEGTARESCRVGPDYWDSHSMAILDREWRAGA
ncbi:MAG: GNAT family protein, partial [Gemmatimonadota bacterium]